MAFRGQRNSSEADRVLEGKGQPNQDIDWKDLFQDLWTALQGVRDCLDTWEEDREWANENPNKAYPSTKSEGLGRKFQMFQFANRLRHDDMQPLVEEIRRIEKLKIARKGQVDTRGYVK